MIKFKQSLIIIFIAIIFTEIFSSILIKLSNKFQVFRIWSFTEQTENGRITLKKNHTSNMDDQWTIFTDKNRFRVETSIINKEIDKQEGLTIESQSNKNIEILENKKPKSNFI